MDMLAACGQYAVFMIRFEFMASFLFVFGEIKLKLFHGQFLISGLERATYIWENTLHELCRLQEEI